MELDELVAALDGFENVGHAGDAFRHVGAGRSALSGEGARRFGGRWNPPRSFATLYLASDADTAVREFLRMASKLGVPPDGFLPRNLFTYEVRLQKIADLTDAENQTSVGLDGSWLTNEDNRRCQAVGEAAHHAGFEAVVAPSAAGAGQVLAVFLDRMLPGSVVKDIGSEVWESLPTPT